MSCPLYLNTMLIVWLPIYEPENVIQNLKLPN